MRAVAAGVVVLSLGIGVAATSVAACAPVGDPLVDMSRLPAFGAPFAHPLIGRVIDLRARAAEPQPCTVSDIEQLVRALGAGDTGSGWGARARLLVLGEVHDNPTHHALRAVIVEAIFGARSGRPQPAFVFEHIRADQQTALDKFADFDRRARRLGTVGDLFGFLAWDKSGWPDQQIFAPLFAAAIAARRPIRPGDPPRETVRRVGREGLAGLEPAEITRLGLGRPLDPAAQDALLGELEASHCGLMPKARFTRLAEAQRYRDAHLAAALVAAGTAEGAAVLFAGNGHARTDRGVPYYVRQIAPHQKVVAVMLIEVENGQTDATAYVPRAPDGGPAADYIIFTPRTERADPCEEMKKAFAKPN